MCSSSFWLFGNREKPAPTFGVRSRIPVRVPKFVLLEASSSTHQEEVNESQSIDTPWEQPLCFVPFWEPRRIPCSQPFFPKSLELLAPTGPKSQAATRRAKSSCPFSPAAGSVLPSPDMPNLFTAKTKLWALGAGGLKAS